MSGYRLETGGVIDRSQTLEFTFDKKTYAGFAGDTLASALLANGVKLMGRSFKYHRPRGVVTAGSSEPNALMEIGMGGRQEPNVRASVQELYDGLISRSQNRWPTLENDIGAINSLASSMFVAGFYYKTFMWPKAFWEKIYEPIIRRAAGLGSATHEPDPDRYEKAFLHCDLLVIGSGPTGLMAALTAGRAGARVVLVDENHHLGGTLLYERDVIDGRPAHDWAAAAIAELKAMSQVTVMPRATCYGCYDSNQFGVLERVQKHVAEPSHDAPIEKLWRIFAKRAVLASGAEERPIVFGGNDTPGVMQAGAVRHYLNRFAVAAGRRAVIFTNNDSGYRTARDLAANGVTVAAIIDSREQPPELDGGGAPVIPGAVIVNVKGGKNVKEVLFDRGQGEEHISADLVAVSGGWSPIVHLTCHRGLKPVWNEELAAFVPPDTGPDFVAAGSANGAMTLGECLAQGAAASGFKAKGKPPVIETDWTYAVEQLWSVPQSTGKAFVDFQNDVTMKDIPLAAQEGYTDVELTKRYTTLGMATDQGKLSNINGLALLAKATGKTIPEVGTTTFRPFYTPVSLGALAGPYKAKHFQPTRKTAMHDWAQQQGAVFVEAGQWYRAQWFPRAGETTWLESVIREVKATRERVGVCDVSTLGKIDIHGSDTAEFLNRLYCNGWKTLAIGKARYGLMLREDGFVFDDGTTSRLSENHYFMTTTTANAGGVMAHMEFCHQALWPELDVQFVSITEQWAQMAIAGPKARATLQKLISEDISDEHFPYLGAGPVTVLGGIKGRLFRISFSGELAYELSVPADYGDAVIRAVMHAGHEFGITPYGTEALSVMRIEKGHVAGSELNGMTTADDLGLGRMMSTKKDYIGRMMAQREAMLDPMRPQFIGLKPVNPAARIHAGSHLLKVGDEPSMAADQGYVTSMAFSPMLDSWIALAMLKNGRARHGETIRVWDGIRNLEMEAEVCDPIFFDPEHEKLHG